VATSVLAGIVVIALAAALVLGGPAVVLAPLILLGLFALTFGLVRRADGGRFRRRTGAPSTAEASYEPVREPPPH
jgi:hypothetical protein